MMTNSLLVTDLPIIKIYTDGVELRGADGYQVLWDPELQVHIQVPPRGLQKAKSMLDRFRDHKKDRVNVPQ